MKRRDFLTRTSAAAGAFLVAPRAAQSADAHIEIDPARPIGVIPPELHGHFIEHLGGVIYDGVWVGENSRVPNTHGIRQALIEHMRRLQPTVVRWPGGCFADSYNWRDGVGPRAKRPRRTNFWADARGLAKLPGGPAKYDPNEFGTEEFMAFCRLSGAEPYVAGNVRSLTPLDFDQWVEYCNSPRGSTTLADLRASGGHPDPHGVRYWGVGNESWGCGGGFTPEGYAAEFRRFTAWVPDYGVSLRFIASGPNGGDLAWTRGLFESLSAKGRDWVKKAYGSALHYYCGTTGEGDAVRFTVNDWYELLGKADRMESLVTDHWLAMSEHDPQHHVKLVVDEWGAWHHAGTEPAPPFLFGQTPTMRDALISALTLDTFHRHADKVVMSNAAQLINCIHCLFLAHEDRFVVTPNFHVFEMHKAHVGGTSVAVETAAPSISYSSEGKDRTLWGLAGSASIQGKKIVLSVVNPHVSEERQCPITVLGANIRAARARTLAASDIHAHNSFELGDAVRPVSETAPVGGGPFVWKFRPASVTLLELELG